MNGSLKSLKRPREQNAAASPPAEFALTKDEIVQLSLTQIQAMSHDELIALIRLANVPLLHGNAMEHLPYSDRDTLERLAFLAQRTLRNQADYGDLPQK